MKQPIRTFPPSKQAPKPATKPIRVEPAQPFTPIYFCLGFQSYGKADTKAEAVKLMQKAYRGSFHRAANTFNVYECHPATTLTGMGDFSYPTGHEPKLVQQVRSGLAKAAVLV